MHRHLRGRLPCTARAPVLNGSDSASSLPLPDAATAVSGGRGLAAASVCESDQTEAPDHKISPDVESSTERGGDPENDAAAANVGVSPSHASANGEVAERSKSSATGGSGGEWESRVEAEGVERGVEGIVRGEVRYFEKKRAPIITGWWESAAAFSAVMLLPLISVVPCATTAVRDDDVVV